MSIKIGILGYGNLGKGVEAAVNQNDDMELAAVYTRRDPASVKIATPDVPVLSAEQLEAGEEPIDVLIICGGSATDLPVMTPRFAALYNVIDSFDTHARIPRISRMSTPPQRKPAKSVLFPPDGIRGCSR